MTTFSTNRFTQMVMACMVILFAAAINVLLNDLILVSSVQFLLIAIFAFSFFLAKKGKVSLAISIFLYSAAIALSLTMWQSGLGLYNAVIGIFPFILILTTLIGGMRDIIIVSLILACSVTGIGLETIYDWDSFKVFDVTYHNMADTLLLLTLSGFIVSIFSSDFKKILAQLSLENKKLHESKKNIYHLAHYDHLTNLQNRIMTQERYNQLLATVDFNQSVITLYFIDLDNFKEINDLISHDAGDNVLIEVARRLNQLTDSNDMVCRLGGDEFLVIINRPITFSDHAFTKSLLHSITQPYFTHETEIDVTTSIGIATIAETGINFDEACKRADLAMYKAKQQGKNTYQYYDDALREQSIRRTAIVLGLKKAVKNNLLDLYFQPKVDLITEEVIGAEALLRWTRDNSYQSSPQEFIPLIESSEIIIEIGEWVLRQACLHCKQWHDAGHTKMHVAVNVSAMQLLRNNFKHIVSSALEEADLAPQYLEIELTEYLLIKKTEHISAQLESIKSMGVKLAIDDFGTGYSNLSYLTKFKVDSLKLDKSFIQQINHSSKNMSIVTAIIAMANIINVSTVAEGIETETEWKILKSLGCQYGQGYFWDKPLAHDVFISRLAKYKHT